MVRTSPNLRVYVGATLAAVLAAGVAPASERSFVQESCAGCHAIEAPDYRALGFAERFERAAPPLYYAGNKYREEWLVRWLHQPRELHPAGYLQPSRFTASDAGDVLDTSLDGGHPALDETRARQVAAWLMTLRPHDELAAGESYTPGSVALRIGMLNFRRFNACSACHQDEAGEGGVSGPELHSAWERLQPEYIASYVADPTRWDPHSAMPVPELNEEAVHRLADYLHTIHEEEP